MERSKNKYFLGLFLSLIVYSLPSFAANPHTALSDRTLTDKTGWWYIANATPDQIVDRTKKGYRLIDLEITQSNPIKFTATFVKNEGAYHKSWWGWYYNATPEFLSKKLNDYKARILDLEVNSNGLYTVILTPNTGEDNKSWWYYTKISATTLKEKLSKHQARLVDLDPYPGSNDYFSAVMVKNTGIDASGWWYYTNIPFNDISAKLKELKARIVDIERKPNGDYTLLLVPHKNEGWYYFINASLNDFSRFISDRNLRAIDLEIFSKSGQWYFNASTLQNLAPGESIPPIKPNVLDFNNNSLKTDAVTGFKFPDNMPAIYWPANFKNCSASEKKSVQEGWAKGHYYLWRAKQLLDFIASEPKEKRPILWEQGFNYASCKNLLTCWSPRAWFGPYDADRFEKIRGTISKLFNERFLAQKYHMKITCPSSCIEGYSGYHAVVGHLNFCPPYFNSSLKDRADTIIHEVLHWLTVPGEGLYVTDIHTRWYMDGICKSETKKFYGEANAFKLANTQGCFILDSNYKKAYKNNDNYSIFSKYLGLKIDNGGMNTFSSF